MRAPRRSERFPSLVRVDTINGRPADEVAEGTRFEDLPGAFPSERLELGSDDPTVKAIEWLTPFGKGSRVVIAGAGARRQDRGAAPARRGARRPAREGLEVTVVLAGVRPEEIADWGDGGPSARRRAVARPRRDSQAQAIEQAVEQAAASPPAAATPSCSSTRSTGSAPGRPRALSPPPATSPTAAR